MGSVCIGAERLIRFDGRMPVAGGYPAGNDAAAIKGGCISRRGHYHWTCNDIRHSRQSVAVFLKCALIRNDIMLTAPADRPVVNLRTYSITPRKMGEFLEVFDRMAMPVLLETLGEPIGFYVTAVGKLNQVVHLWAYRDFADMEARWKARDAHPDFQAYLKATVHLIVAQEDQVLRAVPLPSLESFRAANG